MTIPKPTLFAYLILFVPFGKPTWQWIIPLLHNIKYGSQMQTRFSSRIMKSTMLPPMSYIKRLAAGDTLDAS